MTITELTAEAITQQWRASPMLRRSALGEIAHLIEAFEFFDPALVAVVVGRVHFISQYYH